MGDYYDYFNDNTNNSQNNQINNNQHNYQNQQQLIQQQQQQQQQQQMTIHNKQINDFKINNDTIISNNINGSNNVQDEHLKFIDPIYRSFCTDVGILIKEHTKSAEISRTINKNKQFKLMFSPPSINITYLLLLINNLEIKHNVKCARNLLYKKFNKNKHIKKISKFDIL